MPVRNEAWCVGLTARVALHWCDELVCADNCSTDESNAILEQIARETGRLWIISDPDPTWHEMNQRQFLLNAARAHGATHIALVDADELLTPGCSIVEHSALADVTSHKAQQSGSMLQLPLYNTRGSICRYHANGLWGQRWVSVAFRDNPRLRWDGDRFHKREPEGHGWILHRPIQQGDGGVIHLWGASERRLIAKHALYKMRERLRWPSKPIAQINAYYDQAIRPIGSWTFTETKAEWWSGYEDLIDQYLYLDIEPWQEAECKRLIDTHGKDMFRGLDLFGVV